MTNFSTIEYDVDTQLIMIGPSHWKYLEYYLPREGVAEYFSTEQRRVDAFCRARWPNGLACPLCGKSDFLKLKRTNLYHCRQCRYQFSITAGTVLHGSKADLLIWFVMAERMIKTLKESHLRNPKLVTLRGDLAISLPATAIIRKKLLSELSKDRGGILGTAICSKSLY